MRIVTLALQQVGQRVHLLGPRLDKLEASSFTAIAFTSAFDSAASALP